VASRDWPPARLHIVTGKGGTGKSTAAAALALALAAGGRRSLLVEVEGRQGIAQLFDTAPLPYEERRIAVAPGGGEVRALAVDPEEALLEYLEMFYNLRRAGRMLRRAGAIDFATTAAPGLRDVLLIGKVKEATTRVADGKRVYDAVVLDAPPTGRIGRFLNVTTEVAGLARIGPIKSQSEGVTALLTSTQTAIHVVTVLEEMPVQESGDAVRDLRKLGMSLGTVIVNMVRPPLLPAASLARTAAGRLDMAKLKTGLRTAGLPERYVTGLAAEATAHAVRIGLEAEMRSQVDDLGLPTYDLPLLSGPVDLGALYELASRLTESGVGAA
jgi:anion-transporting  ArsA/GET3 family ATPase